MRSLNIVWRNADKSELGLSDASFCVYKFEV